jgi:ferredoxin
VKLVIESAKCCGFGECVALAPDIFALGADNRVVFVGAATVREGDEDRAREAAFSCPAEAIEVAE